ncbi:hypothetical protein F5887DRAFT_98462 [Amanita rubescens]|nr:hypothetical protein F5887DRAFT_98462 [Amanita rubescens]
MFTLVHDGPRWVTGVVVSFMSIWTVPQASEAAVNFGSKMNALRAMRNHLSQIVQSRYVVLRGTKYGYITLQGTHNRTEHRTNFTRQQLQSSVPPASELETKVTSLSTSETFVEVIFNTMFEAGFEAGFLMAAEFVRPSIASATGPHALQPHIKNQITGIVELFLRVWESQGVQESLEGRDVRVQEGLGGRDDQGQEGQEGLGGRDDRGQGGLEGRDDQGQGREGRGGRVHRGREGQEGQAGRVHGPQWDQRRLRRR